MKKRILAGMLSAILTAALVCPAYAFEDTALLEETDVINEADTTVISDTENFEALEAYTENASFSSAIVGSLDMATAPELQLGTTYTFDYNSKYNADLSVSEKWRKTYFKYTLTEDGFYDIRFKSAACDETDIRLEDSAGNNVENGGNSYMINSAHQRSDMSLKAGVYYVYIYAHGDETYGSIYFGKRGTTISDPEYNENQEVKHNTEKGIAANLSMAFAPRLEFGETYTFDFRQKYESNLYVTDAYKTSYVKYIVPEDGFYTVRFKSATAEEEDFKLADANGNYMSAKNYLSNSAYDQSDIALSKGVHYISIYTHGEDSYGSICLAKRGTKIIDPEYNTEQEINTATQIGTKGSPHMGFAPRLETGSTYTFDFRQKYDSNLYINNAYEKTYFKYLIPEDGVYNINLSSTAAVEVDMYIKDSYGSNLFGASFIQNSAKEKNDLVLSAGTHYISIYLHGEDGRGSFTLKKVGKAPSKDKDKDKNPPAVTENHTITYIGTEDLTAPVELPKTFTWSESMKAIKLPNKSQMIREGYTFVKWADRTTGKKVASITKKNNADLNIEAVWKENTYKIKYKVTAPKGFKASEKINDKNAYSYESSTVTIMGSGVTAASKNSQDVYKLIGWSTIKDSNTVMYKTGDKNLSKLAGNTAKNKKLVLYPVWSK